MSTSSHDSAIVFTGNEPEGCASFIRSIIRYAFQVGKQYDRRWMAYFASTCLVNEASRWYTTLNPEERTDWKPFCNALLRRFPLPETDGSEKGSSQGGYVFPSASSVSNAHGRSTRSSTTPETDKSTPNPGPASSSSHHLQPPRPPRPTGGTKYSNSMPRTPPPPPSSQGLIRLDFFDASIPSRYISSQLRIGYATVYKADLDGVGDQGRALALNVCFERSERGAFRMFTSDNQRNCIAVDKKSSDFSYLALVPHLVDGWAQPPNPKTLQTDVWNVREDGLMQITWQQSPPSLPTNPPPDQRQSLSLQSGNSRVPLGVVCHLKSGTVEVMRNPENYCAKYPGWFEVAMVFEPFTRPEWMIAADRESTMSPTRSPTRSSMRIGSQKLKKRRLSKRIGPGGM